MRRVLGSIVLALGALVLGAVLLLDRQARALGGPLVDDATRLTALDVVGPHPGRGVPPAGNVLACLGPLVDAAPDIGQSARWTDPTLQDVLEGREHLTDAPSVAAALDAHRAWLEDVLACGQLDRVAPVEGLGPLAKPGHLRRQQLPRLQEALTTLGPLQVRRLLEAGQPQEAVGACLETLAVSEVILRAEGLDGMLGVMGPVHTLTRSCGAALAALTQAQAAVAAEAFDRVAAWLPSFAVILELERVDAEVRVFGAWLPSDLGRRLPEGALVMAGSLPRGPVATSALRLYWRRYDSGMRALAVAAGEPRATRTASMKAAMASFDSPLRPMFQPEPFDLRYPLYEAEHRQIEAAVVLLQSAAHLEAGLPLPAGVGGLLRLTEAGAGRHLEPLDPELARRIDLQVHVGK